MSIYRVGPNGDAHTLNVQTRTSDTVIQWTTDLRINIYAIISITAGGQEFTNFTMAYTGNPDDHQNGSLTLHTGTFPASVQFDTTISAVSHNNDEGNYYITGDNTFTDFKGAVEAANDQTPTLSNQQGFTNLTIATSDSKDTKEEDVTYNAASLSIVSSATANNHHLRFIAGGIWIGQVFGNFGTGQDSSGNTGVTPTAGNPVVRFNNGSYLYMMIIPNQTPANTQSDLKKILPKYWELRGAQQNDTDKAKYANLEDIGTGTNIVIANKDGTDLDNLSLTEASDWDINWVTSTATKNVGRAFKPNEAYKWNWTEGSKLNIDAGKTIQFANAALPLMSAKDGEFNITDGSQVEFTTQVKRYIPGSIDSNGDGSQTVLATTANPFTLNIKNNSSFQINNITTTNFSDQNGSANTFLGTPNSVSTRNLIGTFENSSLVDTSDGQTLVYPLASTTYNNFTILLDKGGTESTNLGNLFFLTCNPNARIRDSFKVVNTGFAARFRFTGIAAANNTLADGSIYSVNKANTIAGSLNSQLIWYRFNLVNSLTTKLGLYNPGNINFVFINPQLNNEPYYGVYNFIVRPATGNFREGNVVLATQYNPIFQYGGSALNKIKQELYYGSASDAALTTVKEASERGLIGTIGEQENDATGVTISSTFGLADVNYTANEATAGTEFTSTNSNNNGLNLTFLKTVTEPSGTTVSNKDYNPQNTHFFAYEKRDGFRPSFPRYSFADGAKEALIVPKDAALDKYWQNTTVASIDGYVELLENANPTGTYDSASNTLSVDLDLDTDQPTVDTSNIGVTDAAVIKSATPGDYSIFITDNSGINVNDIHILTNGSAEYTATVISTGINGQVDINVSTADAALIDAVAGSKISGGFTYWSATAGFGLDIKAHRIDWNDIYKTIEYLENNNLITNANLTSDTRTDTTKYNKHFHRFIDTDTPVTASGLINMPDYNLKLNINSTNLNTSTNVNAIDGIDMGTNTLDIATTIHLTIDGTIICKTLTDDITAGQLLNYKKSAITTTTDLTVDGSVLDVSTLDITGDTVLDDITNSTANISETYTGRNATGSDLNITKGVTLTGNATGNTINGTSIAITGTVSGDTIIGSAAYSSGAISNGTNISGVTTVTLNGDVDDSTISSSGDINGLLRDSNSSTLTSSAGDIIIDDADDCILTSFADMTIKNLTDSTATSGATYGGSTNTRSTINSTGTFTMTNEVTGTTLSPATINLGANGTFGQTIVNGKINGTSSSAQTITLNGSSLAAPHTSVSITGTNVRAIVNTPIENSNIGTEASPVNDADFHLDAKVENTGADAINTISLPKTTVGGRFKSTTGNVTQLDINGTVTNSELDGVTINVKATTGTTLTGTSNIIVTTSNTNTVSTIADFIATTSTMDNVTANDANVTSISNSTYNISNILASDNNITNSNITTKDLGVNNILGTSVITTSGYSLINEIEAGTINFNGSTSTSTIGTISGGTITSNATHKLDITTLENGTFTGGILDVTNYVEGGTFTNLTFADVKTNTKATAHTGIYTNVDMRLTNAGNVTLGGSGDVTAIEGPDAEDYTNKYVQTGSDRTQFEVLTTTGGDINDTIEIWSEGVLIVANAHLFDHPELTGTRAGGYRYTVGNTIYEQTQTVGQSTNPLFIYHITKVDTSKKVIINPQLVELTIVPDNGTNNTRHIERAELPYDINFTITNATRIAYKIHNEDTQYIVGNTIAIDESNSNRGEIVEIAAMAVGYKPLWFNYTIPNLNDGQVVAVNRTLIAEPFANTAEPETCSSNGVTFTDNLLKISLANIPQDNLIVQKVIIEAIMVSNNTLDAILYFNSVDIFSVSVDLMRINTTRFKVTSSTATSALTKEIFPYFIASQNTSEENRIIDLLRLVEDDNFLNVNHNASLGVTAEETNEIWNAQANARGQTINNEEKKGLLIPIDKTDSQDVPL